MTEHPPAVMLGIEHGVLVATIENPPVNALSHPVRSGLNTALDRLGSDEALVAMVLTARGRMFCAGADVTEFDAPMRSPQLGDIIERIDQSAKPVIAALDGDALGGGLELALACHYRVAAADARLALPEVKLGTLPGAGGTLRLPRLVGIALALEMIAEGRTIEARKAHAAGLIDAVVYGDCAGEAVTRARQARLPLRRASAMAFPEFDTGAQADAAAALARKYPGRKAPQVAVELLATAAVTPFADATRREHETCRALLASPQSHALRHVFAAERRAARLDDRAPSTQPRTIGHIGIVGPGTMGRGIAMACLDAGLPVVLVGKDATMAAAAKTAIGRAYEGAVKRDRTSADAAADRMARLTPASVLQALAGADLVIEAIDEDLAEKQALISALDTVVPTSAIVATNTSYLDIDELGAATRRPTDFAGMHFFNPANRMKLVEVVRTDRTAPDVPITLTALAKRLGKTPVMVGPSEGFIANRMLAKRTRQALFLLEEGATPRQIDDVLTRFGFPVGPFALADMAGLDVMAATRATRVASMSDRERKADIAEQLVAAGRLGRKSGAGYYAYGDDGKPKDDPAVGALLTAHRQKCGTAPRAIGDEEVLERCLFVLINEGARLIGDGTARSAGDIDVVWTSGLGFPAHLGGPMFHADTLGLPHVRDTLRGWADRGGDVDLLPAALLDELADRDGSFS